MVKTSVMNAYNADVPSGTVRTIYVIDDGVGTERLNWVQSLALEDILYVPGQAEYDEDINPFGASMTHILKRVYPTGARTEKVPEWEIVCMIEAG